MKGFSIFDALSDTREEYLAESEKDYAKKQKVYPKWMKITAAAACVCLLAGGAAAAIRSPAVRDEKQKYEGTGEKKDPQFDYENAVRIPMPEFSLKASDGAASDMAAFFIRNGKYYECCDWGNTWKVGEYVCTANGLIDEWTKKDGYVDGAGSVSGKFYAVEGYDPDFLLCSEPSYDGESVIYINNAGFYLTQGSEILSGGFRMTGEETDIKWISRDDWYHSVGEWKAVSEEALPAVQEMLDGLFGAPFVYMSDVLRTEKIGNIYDTLECCHMKIMTSGGVPVHLRFCRGGYVVIDCIRDVCMKVPENRMPAYEAALSALGIEE